MVNKQPETSDSTGEHDTPVLRLTTNEPDYSELHRFSFARQLLAEDGDIRSGLVYGILKSAWRPKGGLEVHEQSKNTFIFILSGETEKNRIFRESPWFVKGSHLVIKDWPSSQRFDEISFSHSEFWVQVHGLPKGCMTLENVQRIGSLFPRLISWDQSTLGGLESFLHLRVEIDVHTPLLTGFQFQQQGDQVWTTAFKYEKLVDFCYRCGMLGHTQKSCDDFRWKDDDGNYISQPRPQYGPQLRTVAYSPKKHFGSIREGAKSQPIYHAKLLPKALDKLETGSSSKPTISTQQRTVVNEEDHSTMRREEQQEEERVNHAPALLSPALNAFEGQSPSDMITSFDSSAEPPPPSAATQLNRRLLLNEVMTTPQCFGSGKLPDSPSGIQEQATAQGGVYNSAELGLLLSHKVEAQLSLGSKPYSGKRRRCDVEPSGEPVKRACILPHEAIGQPCSSAQLQESLALGRS
ncbi:hypothetical protein SLE2022_038780 [Rubroshorea leprosula]